MSTALIRKYSGNSRRFDDVVQDNKKTKLLLFQESFPSVVYLKPICSVRDSSETIVIIMTQHVY